MALNHWKIAGIEKYQFPVGTRYLLALEKVRIYYLKSMFLEEFLSCVESTIVNRSTMGQGLSCLRPTILIGGDDHAQIQLFGMLVDGFVEEGWMRCAEMEACKSEYPSFVQKQRQLEWTSTRSHPDVGNALTCCSIQAGFRVRRHLYKICVVCKHVGCSFNVAVDSLLSYFMSFSYQHLRFAGQWRLWEVCD